MNSDSSCEPRKFMLLGASFTTRNMGVWVLASGAIASILHSYPSSEISFLDYFDRELSHEIKHPAGSTTVQLVNIRISKKFWLPNHIARLLLTSLFIRLMPSRRLRDRLVSTNTCLSKIQAADVIGSIAGGDSFSDIYGLWRLVYVILPQVLVLLLGKPLVLLPQTIGPFASTLAKAMAGQILKQAAMVYSRDYESLEIARQVNGSREDKLHFCYDMGFLLEPEIQNDRIPRWFVDNVDLSRPVVGLNISGLLYIGGYTQDNMFRLKLDYCRLVEELIQYFILKHNAHVFLVPHVFGSPINSESDMHVCQEIYKNASNQFQAHLYALEDGYNHRELKALIGKCDFFVGSRMHACIAAASQYVPAIALAYSRKFRGVFASIGTEELVIDLQEHDNRSAMDLVDDIYKRRVQIQAMLIKRMPHIRACILDLFSPLGACRNP